mmetsp:Transcript_18669/g.42993  ORF Transcript_18669/g.42993 Transcript_18669/m.42993 type:complete len:93 (+) Transcript_18669:581-859(+)
MTTICNYLRIWHEIHQPRDSIRYANQYETTRDSTPESSERHYLFLFFIILLRYIFFHSWLTITGSAILRKEDLNQTVLDETDQHAKNFARIH